MSPSVRQWLPPQIAERPVIRSTLDMAVSAWSERWFAGATVSVSRTHQTGRRAVSGEIVMVMGESAVRLKLVGEGRTRLAGLALDMVIERLELTESDRRLVEGVARDVMDDLLRTLHTALGLPCEGEARSVPDGPIPHGGLDVFLAEGAGPDLAVMTLPLSDLVAVRLAAMPAPRRPQTPLGALSDAVAEAAVPLRARLGAARLSLGELRSLAVGDVVLLDQVIDEPLDLTDHLGTRVLGLHLTRPEAPSTFTVRS